MKTRHLMAGTLCALLWSGQAASQAPPPGARVEELLELARRQNPELAAMGFEAEAAQARVQPAGALPDPMGRLELRDVGNQMGNGDFNLLPARVGSADAHRGADHSLVGQARPEARSRRGRRGAGAGAPQRHLGRTRGEGEDAAFGSITTSARAEAGAGTAAPRRSLEQLAQARYPDGLVPQQDVVRAQVEKTALRSELLMLETEHHHAAARLNALLRRAAGSAAGGAAGAAPAAATGEARLRRARSAPARRQPAVGRTGSADFRGREEPRTGDEESLSRPHRRRLADPDAQPRHGVGTDVRGEHPAAAGVAPFAGARGGGDGLRGALAQGRRAQSGLRRSGGEPLRAGFRAAPRTTGRQRPAAAGRPRLPGGAGGL